MAGRNISKNFTSDSPGPGAYSNNIQLEKSPAFTMGGNNEVLEHSITPGPGQYNTTSKLGEAPSYSLSRRTEEKVLINSPGPGNFFKIKGNNHQDLMYYFIFKK